MFFWFFWFHTHIVTGDALFRHTVNQKVKVNQSSKISSALGVKKAEPQVESRPPPPYFPLWLALEWNQTWLLFM